IEGALAAVVELTPLIEGERAGGDGHAAVEDFANRRVHRRCSYSPYPIADSLSTMRVVHVTDTFLPKVGGAEIAIDQLVRAMSRLGDQCSVLAQRPRGLRAEIETTYPLWRFPNPR